MTTISGNVAAYLDQRITAVVSARFDAAEQERRQQETERAARREEATMAFRTRFEHALNDAALLAALGLRYASADRENDADPMSYAAFTVDEAELRIYENGGNHAYYRLMDPQQFNYSSRVLADMSAITLADDLLFGLATYRERSERQRQEQAETAERFARIEREGVERVARAEAQVKAPEPPAEPARIISDSGQRRVVELALDESEAKLAMLTRYGVVDLIELRASHDTYGEPVAPSQRFSLDRREMQMLVAAYQAFHAPTATSDDDIATVTDDSGIADDIPF